jgi:hypothetical protein
MIGGRRRLTPRAAYTSGGDDGQGRGRLKTLLAARRVQIAGEMQAGTFGIACIAAPQHHF